MLARRLRRRPNFKSALGRRHVLVMYTPPIRKIHGPVVSTSINVAVQSQKTVSAYFTKKHNTVFLALQSVLHQPLSVH